MSHQLHQLSLAHSISPTHSQKHPNNQKPPNSQKPPDILMRILRDTSIDKWLAQHHYLQSSPAGAIIRMCFEDADKRILGCMLWGHPTARKLCQVTLLELMRMHFIDETPSFIESRCLGLARKHIRKHHPRIKGLIAYTSTQQEHTGTVYKADNWYHLGTTRGASWAGRQGRTDRDLSAKMRWTRSP